MAFYGTVLALVVLSFVYWELKAADKVRARPRPQSKPKFSNLALLREQYIQEQLTRPISEIERAIEDTEAALRHPCNEFEADIQRQNLDCLNTIYVLKLAQVTDEKFWALHKNSIR